MKKKIEEKVDHAREQAKAQLESITEMVDMLNKATEGGTTDEREEAVQAIQEDVLEVSVRSDWHAVGDEDDGPSEFLILLCTGGPAVRIIGELDKYREPKRARLQYQDWGTPWTELILDSEGYDVLLQYAGQFYFGE